MSEESRAFADPVTRSLVAPVRVRPGYGEALARLRAFGQTAEEATAGVDALRDALKGDTTDGVA